MMFMKVNTVRLAIFAALVYVFTVAVQFAQPVTGGYFNFGEAAIYTCALISDPLTTALAAGIGSSLADATTGYGIFAPATLVIKFTEGYVASLLFRKLRASKGWLADTAISLIYVLMISLIGIKYLSGNLSFSMPNMSYSLYIPWELWIAIGILVMLIPLVLERKGGSDVKYASLLLAGLIMVTGYFLYEYFISNPLTGRPSIAAVAEIPVNFGQALVGAAVAIPVYNFLRKAGYTEEYGGIEARNGQTR
jgi:uncharacterized membrane protein